MVGDAVPCPLRMDAEFHSVVGGQGRSGVVAEELVAQSADEAHGDRLGHGMRVLPVNCSERAGRLER